MKSSSGIAGDQGLQQRPGPEKQGSRLWEDKGQWSESFETLWVFEGR